MLDCVCCHCFYESDWELNIGADMECFLPLLKLRRVGIEHYDVGLRFSDPNFSCLLGKVFTFIRNSSTGYGSFSLRMFTDRFAQLL